MLNKIEFIFDETKVIRQKIINPKQTVNETEDKEDKVEELVESSISS